MTLYFTVILFNVIFHSLISNLVFLLPDLRLNYTNRISDFSALLFNVKS